MPHDLATTDGRTAMFYTGEVPWHGLGTRLDAPATAEEAIVAAGLNYQVKMVPMRTDDGNPVIQRKAIIRADTNDVLGVVGNGYQPVQNSHCFGFLDAVVAEGSVRYHTAGALGKGEKIWLLAKLPGHIRVKNSDDLVDRFLLLSNAHDGSAALRVFFTPIRVVCQNTLTLAERRGNGQGVSILHKGDLTAKIREAQEVLGLAKRFYDDAQFKIDRMASTFVSEAQLSAYFKELYPDPEGGKDNSRAQNIRGELHRLFEQGIGHDAPAIKGTTWAAFNAVTEYVDHVRQGRGADAGVRASRKLDSIWFGTGARIKRQAWDMALELAGCN